MAKKEEGQKAAVKRKEPGQEPPSPRRKMLFRGVYNQFPQAGRQVRLSPRRRPLKPKGRPNSPPAGKVPHFVQKCKRRD